MLNLDSDKDSENGNVSYVREEININQEVQEEDYDDQYNNIDFRRS